MPSRDGMFWPIYVYLVASIAIAGSAGFKVGWGTALAIAVASMLSLVAGGGLKAALRWGDKTQKIGGFVVAILIFALAQWLATNFSVWLFGSHLGGNLWCWIGFAIGVIFTNKKLAQPQTAPAPVDPAADLLGKLGDLMEHYPIALMDSYRLPASKQTMKTVIKDVWRREPALRNHLASAYLYLSHFQDGIGTEILDGKLAGGLTDTKDMEAMRQLAVDLTGPKGEPFRQWIAWTKVSTAEMDILLQEWRVFEQANEAVPTTSRD
jgi:hypothetical protein